MLGTISPSPKRVKVQVLTVTNKPTFVIEYEDKLTEQEIENRVWDSYGCQRNGKPHEWKVQEIRKNDEFWEFQKTISEQRDKLAHQKEELEFEKFHINELEKKLRITLAKLNHVEKKFKINWREDPPQKRDFNHAEEAVKKLRDAAENDFLREKDKG